MALGTEPINILGIWHKNLLVHVVEIGARSIFHIRHPLLNPVPASQNLLLTLAAKHLEDFIRNNMSAFHSFHHQSINDHVFTISTTETQKKMSYVLLHEFCLRMHPRIEEVI